MYKGSVDDPGFIKFMGEEAAEFIKNMDDKSEEIESLYQSIVDNYSDVENQTRSINC
jgi:hypothetical protein